MTADHIPHTRRFARSDYKTLGLAALGGALEIYDFIIFMFFALTLSELFFPPQMPEWLRLLQSFGIFVTGYLARPLGGSLQMDDMPSDAPPPATTEPAPASSSGATPPPATN